MGALLASARCRTLETAELSYPGRVLVESTINSFFSAHQGGTGADAGGAGGAAGLSGPGTLFVSTQQVNITPLTGIFSGERRGGGVAAGREALRVVRMGRL